MTHYNLYYKEKLEAAHIQVKDECPDRRIRQWFGQRSSGLFIVTVNKYSIHCSKLLFFFCFYCKFIDDIWCFNRLDAKIMCAISYSLVCSLNVSVSLLMGCLDSKSIINEQLSICFDVLSICKWYAILVQ